jgi:hypothetical protein
LREDLRTKLFYLGERLVQPRLPDGKQEQLIKQIVLLRPCEIFPIHAVLGLPNTRQIQSVIPPRRLQEK